jgi:hypothetical protein
MSIEHETLIKVVGADYLIVRRERRDGRVGEDKVVHHSHLVLEDDRAEIGVDGECGSHFGEWQVVSADSEEGGRRKVSCGS